MEASGPRTVGAGVGEAVADIRLSDGTVDGDVVSHRANANMRVTPVEPLEGETLFHPLPLTISLHRRS